jgi:hypothetical protein
MLRSLSPFDNGTLLFLSHATGATPLYLLDHSIAVGIVYTAGYTSIVSGLVFLLTLVLVLLCLPLGG